MRRFSNVYISARVRAALQKIVRANEHRKFWELVSKLREGHFDIPGLNVEKLYGRKLKLFSARMSREMRLIFSMRKELGGDCDLVIHEVNHHDAAYDRIQRSEVATNASRVDAEFSSLKSASDLAALDNDLESSVESADLLLQFQLFQVPDYLLRDPDKYNKFEKGLDRYLKLSAEQEEILELKDKVSLVQGAAGTGKTTLALFQALYLSEKHREDSVYLFTYHEELACVCRAYKVNLEAAPERLEPKSESSVKDDSGIKVFSYIEFCRNFLRSSLSKKDKQRHWISRNQSLDILRQIISSKPRWTRMFSAENLYGMIYSILKGRFMPGTENLPASKDDYERIFRDYGKTPETLADTLEIFTLYQSRLEKNNLLDEADLIRLSFESLKQNALLTASQRRLWIIIDEVQDFTELEWKSILLFWENHCKQDKHNPTFPFFSGDINQNISRSGFRWQELETYLQSILRDFHRPNSLLKIVLHQNYRNTRQIYQLAAFVRSFASDSSDLGLAPQFEGELPQLVIASDQELLDLILLKIQSEELANPLVLLIENESSLEFFRQKLRASQSIFILPLSSSKGMEFEDVIIHRAFSSLAEQSGETASIERSRLFDLWYMGITRARSNLLLVQNESDSHKLASLGAKRLAEFYGLLERAPAAHGFDKFWQRRETNTPDYNVIFLERKLAQDLWAIFLKEQAALTDKSRLSDYARECCQRAVNLWRRCLDYASLGKALMHLGEYAEAATFLKRASLPAEAAQCLASAGQFNLAANEFEQMGDLSEAARCYQQAQDFARAARLNEEQRQFQLAAENYQKAGMLDHAAHNFEHCGNFAEAAEIYRNSGENLQAAECYENNHDFLNAAEMFWLAGCKLRAAGCFEKSGRYETALDLFLGENEWVAAAKQANQLERFEDAAQYYLQANLFAEAARAYDTAQNFARAAELYEKTANFQEAARAYEESGQLRLAALMHEKSADWKKALALADACADEQLRARCLEKLGDFTTAAEIFQKEGFLAEAANCFERAHDFAAAADLHLQLENHAQAAFCLAKLDSRLDAAKLYVVSGQISSAYELVMSTGLNRIRPKDEDKFKDLLSWCVETRRSAAAAQLLELKKDFESAAEKYRECMMFSKAAECLEKSGRNRDAAKVYRQSGEMEKAANCYRLARQWQDAGKCFEQIKKWHEAKDMYQRCRDTEGVNRCDNALNWF